MKKQTILGRCLAVAIFPLTLISTGCGLVGTAGVTVTGLDEGTVRGCSLVLTNESIPVYIPELDPPKIFGGPVSVNPSTGSGELEVSLTQRPGGNWDGSVIFRRTKPPVEGQPPPQEVTYNATDHTSVDASELKVGGQSTVEGVQITWLSSYNALDILACAIAG